MVTWHGRSTVSWRHETFSLGKPSEEPPKCGSVLLGEPKDATRDVLCLIDFFSRARGLDLRVSSRQFVPFDPLTRGNNALQFIIPLHLGSLVDLYSRKRVFFTTMPSNILSPLTWIQSTTFSSPRCRDSWGLSEGTFSLLWSLLHLFRILSGFFTGRQVIADCTLSVPGYLFGE